MREILKKVRKIEIMTNNLVEGLLQGAYHSIFKGTGIEFSEVREYISGDDVRIIDWNVTARMNEPFVKEFIEERDLTVHIVFDISASGDFGSDTSKKETAALIAASLMFAAIKNNDRVGLCMFSNIVESFIPPRKGRKHMLRLIREIVNCKPENKTTNLSSSLVFLSKIIKKRSIVFIISDFLTDFSFQKYLKILKNRNDVIAININDVREEEIPDIGYIELEDEETGEQILVNTSDPKFRTNYTKMINDKNKKLKTLLAKAKVDLIELHSGEAFEIPLRKFFKLRARRLVR